MDKIYNIVEGDLISTNTFISGTEYRLVSSIAYTQNNVDRNLKVGDTITTFDHDDNEYLDGKIDGIFVIGDRVELSIDAPYGRFDLEEVLWD